MGIGIGDVASLAANSLGAAIGLGTKLPKYQDNSAQLELAKMRAEADKQKQYQKQLDDEKKNWQIPHDKIHPMIVKNETEPGVAKATIRIQEIIARDGMGALNGGAVYEQTQLIRKLIGSGIQQTQAMKDDFNSVQSHPDVAKFRDNDLADYIQNSNYEKYKEKLGDREYAPDFNVSPNIDLNKAFDDILKKSSPKLSDKGQAPVDIGRGKLKYNLFEEYSVPAVAYQSKEFWDSSRAAQLMYPNPTDFTTKVIELAQERQKNPKEIRTFSIPGADPSGRNTITPEAQQYTVTLSSPTTSEKGRVYVDTAGNEYTQGITKKDIKKGTKTITAWVASDGKTQVTPKKGTELAITTSEYYPIGTANKLTANTSSTLVIDGQTGMQTSSIGKQFDINGIGKFDYVTDKNGKAVIVSDKSRGNLKQTPKSAYFAYAKEDLGMKDGEQKYRFYLVKVDPNIIRAAETAKIKFPDHIKQSAQGGGTQQTAPATKQQTTAETGASKENPIPITNELIKSGGFKKGMWYSRPDGSIQQYK